MLSPLMFPLNLSEKEVDYLVEFLKTLTGSNVDELILDAKAAPIGEISLNDPNWFHNGSKMASKWHRIARQDAPRCIKYP